MEGGAVVVTGAAAGIGRACARALCGAGGRAVLVDLHPERLEEAAAALSRAGRPEPVSIAGDLCDPATPARVADAVAAEGGLRALAHAAGLSGALESQAARILEVNLVSTARLLDALEPQVRDGSAGVLLASQAAYFVAASATAAVDALLDEPLAPDLAGRLAETAGPLAQVADGAYGLSKRGVQRLAVRRAPAWGARGGRLVSVSPGPTDTAMGRGERESHPDAVGTILKRTPVGARLGRAEEIASVVAFLCSPDASFVSGVDLLVDGGSTNQVLGGS